MTTTTAPASSAVPGTEFLLLEPSAIAIHPDNPRRDVGDVTELAESIGEVGIIEPLIVAPPHPKMTKRALKGATWLLIAGHRRLAAAQMAGLEVVPAMTRADLASREQQVEAMLVENLHRVDLTPIEEGKAYQMLLDLPGATEAGVAEKIRKPVSRIRDRLKLISLPEQVQEKVQAHQVTITDALAVAEFDDDPKAQKELLDAVGTDRWRWTLERTRQERQAEAEYEAAVARFAKTGLTVLKKKPEKAVEFYQIGLSNYSVKVGSAQQVKWEKEVHGDCPGRTAWRSSYRAVVELGCTQPGEHKKKPKKTKVELAAEAAARKARAEYAEGRDVAAGVRRTFVFETLQMLIPSEERQRAALVDTLIKLTGLNDLWGQSRSKGEEWRLLAQLLGSEIDVETTRAAVDNGRSPERAEVKELLTSLLNTTPIPTLVLLLTIVPRLGSEVHLATHDLPEDGLRQGYEWIALLRDELHYDFTEWERENLTWSEYDVDRSEHVNYNVDGEIPATAEVGDE